MTKDEYLKLLRKEINALTIDEQNQAIEYYSDYFDEAQDDAKVIEELGTPEELAKTIVQKFANTLVNTNDQTQKTGENNQYSTDSQSQESSDSDYSQSVFYEFAASEVRNLAINVGAIEVAVIAGDSYLIESRGISDDMLNVELSDSGNLSITNTRRLNLKFFSHDRKRKIFPRLLITVPAAVNLNRFSVKLGAGNLLARKLNITAVDSEVEVGAGNITLGNLDTGKLNIRCGMGNIGFKGILHGKCNVDCGMGNVKMEILEDKDTYSYDAKVGLGSVEFGDTKKSGFSQVDSSEIKEKHVSINCGLGNVTVKFSKQ